MILYYPLFKRCSLTAADIKRSIKLFRRPSNNETLSYTYGALRRLGGDIPFTLKFSRTPGRDDTPRYIKVRVNYCFLCGALTKPDRGITIR